MRFIRDSSFQEQTIKYMLVRQLNKLRMVQKNIAQRDLLKKVLLYYGLLLQMLLIYKECNIQKLVMCWPILVQ